MQLDHDSCDAVAGVVDLVNSESRSRGDDELTTPAALADFLDAHRISGLRTNTEAELRAVRRLRGRVRSIFETAAAGDRDGVMAEINALVADAGAVPRLVEHDGNPPHLHFTPADAPLHHRLGAEMAVALAIVVRDGGMDRLRVCESPDCRSVLVDLSRNHSRRYCGALCANRQHVAAYRARRGVNTRTS